MQQPNSSPRQLLRRGHWASCSFIGAGRKVSNQRLIFGKDALYQLSYSRVVTYLGILPVYELLDNSPLLLISAVTSIHWRRRRDSNPRYAIHVCLISSQVHSTTLPLLLALQSIASTLTGEYRTEIESKNHPLYGLL
jgi:hypothetical protein